MVACRHRFTRPHHCAPRKLRARSTKLQVHKRNLCKRNPFKYQDTDNLWLEKIFLSRKVQVYFLFLLQSVLLSLHFKRNSWRCLNDHTVWCYFRTTLAILCGGGRPQNQYAGKSLVIIQFLLHPSLIQEIKKKIKEKDLPSSLRYVISNKEQGESKCQQEHRYAQQEICGVELPVKWGDTVVI